MRCLLSIARPRPLFLRSRIVVRVWAEFYHSVPAAPAAIVARDATLLAFRPFLPGRILHETPGAQPIHIARRARHARQPAGPRRGLLRNPDPEGDAEFSNQRPSPAARLHSRLRACEAGLRRGQRVPWAPRSQTRERDSPRLLGDP